MACRNCNKKKTETQTYMNTNRIQVWRIELGKRVEKTVNEGFFEEKLKAKGWQRVETVKAVEPEIVPTETPKKSRKKKEVTDETE
jgi:hypothetical protein